MIEAVHDYIIVRVIYKKTQQGGLIELPNNYGLKGRFAGFHAIVISVGPTYPYDIEVGQEIIFRRHEGIRIEYEGKTFWALKKQWVEGAVQNG